MRGWRADEDTRPDVEGRLAGPAFGYGDVAAFCIMWLQMGLGSHPMQSKRSG